MLTELSVTKLVILCITLVLVVLIVATCFAATPAKAEASGPTNPWVIVQHEVVPGDTYPLLDATYNVSAGTIYGMNGGAVLYYGSYINVPTRTGHRVKSGVAPGLKPGKSYPPGYNANLWD